MLCKCTVEQCISLIYWNCVYKGKKSKSHLPYRVLTILWLHTIGPDQVACTIGDLFWCDHQQAIWKTVQTCPEPAHLLRVCRLSAWLTCSRNKARLWFCQQHQEFPPSLPFKKSPGQMLLNFSVQMRNVVSNMAQAADNPLYFGPLNNFDEFN